MTVLPIASMKRNPARLYSDQHHIARLGCTAALRVPAMRRVQAMTVRHLHLGITACRPRERHLLDILLDNRYIMPAIHRDGS